MSSVSFQDLVKINQLLSEIDTLSGQLQKLEEELRSKEQFFEHQIRSRKEKLKQKFLQSKLLETIKQELAELREQELGVFAKLSQLIDEAITNFLKQGELANFIKQLKQTLPEASLQASRDMQPFLGDLPFEEIPGTQKLRIITRLKDYIFDLDTLKPRLQMYLLVQKLSN